MNSAVDKFKSSTHYIISKCPDPKDLGATRLNKILWYADSYAYKATGNTITGSTYLRHQRGPVPSRVLASLRQLKSEGKIEITDPIAPYQPRLYESLAEPDTSVLSKVEKEYLDGFSKIICESYSANSISEASHDEIWESAMDGEEIPVEATLVSSSGDYNPKVQAWADEVISTNV